MSLHPRDRKRWVRRLGLVAVVALWSSGCSGSTGGWNAATPAPESVPVVAEPVRVVVDTDMGFDDVRALVLLAHAPDVEIVAVTVTGAGIARCPAGAENAKALLVALGLPDVPVACGRRAPLEGANLAPTAWRDAADELAGMGLAASPLSESAAEGAVDLLIDVIGASPAPVAVLTLGPLTNLAEAFAVDPTLAGRIGRLVMMGGAVDVGGNTLSFLTPPVAEFNVWVDPVAAERVLAAGLDVTIVPLDATNDVPVTPASYVALGAGLGGDDAAARMVAGFVAENPLIGGIYHWDDLAAATILAPDLVEVESMRISVVTEAGRSNGQTVEDPAGVSVDVAVAADRVAFEALFYDSLGLSPPDATAHVTDALVVFDGENCSYDGPDPLPAEMTIEVTNSSDRSVLGITVGVYDPGTTAEDLAAYGASDPVGPPSFLTLISVAPLPAATTSYWVFHSPAGATLSCIFDMGSGVDLAGPRLG